MDFSAPRAQISGFNGAWRMNTRRTSLWWSIVSAISVTIVSTRSRGSEVDAPGVARELVLLELRPGHGALIDGHDEHLAARYPGVDRADGHPRAPAHLLEGEPLEALLLEHLESSVEDDAPGTPGYGAAAGDG